MSYAGIWQLSIATPMGEQKAELEFTQDGETVTGVSRNELEGELKIQDAVLKGNKLTYSIPISRPIRATSKLTLVFNEDGVTATGTAKAGAFPGAKLKATKAS
jgi:hypothetical protein